MSADTVSRFFDSISGQYSDFVERCVPWYRDMFQALFDYLPPDRSFANILELGCGTGNLSLVLREHFPDAALTLVDISGESLVTCRERLGSDARATFVQKDFRDLAFPPNSFDFVVSTISIHHLTSAEKRSLLGGIHGWLTADGMLSYADQFRGVTDDLYDRHVQLWQQRSTASGATDDEWAMWMQHQADHDFHDSLPDQLQWLTQAGFPVVDCTWRYLLWCVIQARKQ